MRSYNLLCTTFQLRFLSSLSGSYELETSNQVGCLLCIACPALHCRKEENRSFRTARSNVRKREFSDCRAGQCAGPASGAGLLVGSCCSSRHSLSFDRSSPLNFSPARPAWESDGFGLGHMGIYLGYIRIFPGHIRMFPGHIGICSRIFGQIGIFRYIARVLVFPV